MTGKGDGTEMPQTLPDEEARRLLARASEIESAQSSQLSLAELREVAWEAGIAPNAFEQAVVELRQRQPAAPLAVAKPDSKVPRRLKSALLNVVITVGIVLATLSVLMVLVDVLD